MKALSRPLLLLSLFCLPWLGSVAAPLPDAPQFAHETSDLKADARVRYGQLANGLRYAILPNQEPRERVSLRLLVMAGSLHETDDQQGLAHFLEHMAFNGSTHYPAGTLIEFFQRMGMSFGGDTNAHTSFDHTAYLLELPHVDEKTTEEGFRVLADYAGGLLLSEKEIDQERGIILSEKRDRDSVGLREWVAEAGFTLQGTRIPTRIPIGLASVIEQAPRERFVALYDAWYRPDRLAIVAVGDVQPERLEAQIKAAFSGLQPRAPAPASIELGTVAAGEKVRAFAHHEAESGATRVSIQVIRNETPTPDSRAARERDLPLQLVSSLLSRRLDILSRKPDAPFTQGGFSTENIFQAYRTVSLELGGKAERWQESLTLAENELRRALQYGFTTAELTEAKANLRNALEEAARTAATRRSDALADALMDSLREGDVFTTPADDLALFGPVLERITAEDCLARLRELFAGQAPVVTVIGNAKLGATPAEAEAAILATLQQASQATVTPPAQDDVKAFAYTSFGEEGKVSVSRRIDDLDVTLATLSNGVRVNFKKTDFEKGKIRLLMRVGGGQLTQPLDKPGLNFLVDYALFAGGLGEHSLDELQRVLAGKTVSVQIRAASDAFVFTGETNAQDLRLNLQLFAAYLTDPGFRPEALDQLRKQMEAFYTRLEHQPEGPLQMQVPRFLAQGDPRFGFPSRNEANARDFSELKAWLTPEFAQGAIELSIVGDFDLPQAREAILQTLGALPKRGAKPSYTEERKVFFPAPTAKSYTFVSELPKAYVYIAWPTTDNRDITTTRQLNLLANVFSDRLRTRIREELGDAYSPYAMSAPSDAYQNYGYMAAVISASPDKVDAIARVTLAIAQDLIDKGVTDDETERAKQPVLTSIREAARTNPYWLQTVLSSAQETPQRLDWRRSIETGHAAITAAQLHALAKRFLVPARAFTFTTLPGEKASDEPTIVFKPAPRPKPTPSPASAATQQGQGNKGRPTPTPTPPNDF